MKRVEMKKRRVSNLYVITIAVDSNLSYPTCVNKAPSGTSIYNCVPFNLCYEYISHLLPRPCTIYPSTLATCFTTSNTLTS